MNRIHIAAEHRDLEAMLVKRLTDFKGKTGIQDAGFQIYSGDGLPNCELNADHMLRCDPRGELAGRQDTEIVSTDADTQWQRRTQVTDSIVIRVKTGEYR